MSTLLSTAAEELAERAKMSHVTLVIPGRNCASTLDRCLSSVVPLLSVVDLAKDPGTERCLARSTTALREIIFVDDGSTDATPEIAARYPVRLIQGTGQGPGAARNLGWQAAETDLIWFIDSDCVAEPDALEKLLPHMNNPDVAGVGGSYANLYPDSLVATLIHEEIVARHRRMKREVDFLATFNVIYRRSVLAELSGFNETLKLAQDAEFAYRVRAAGHCLNFELESRVGHHHPRNVWRYLKTQARQGYYRIKLYRQHPTKISGDSYAGMLDYVQPPLALLTLTLLPLCGLDTRAWVLVAISLIFLVLAQAPLAWRIFSGLNVRTILFVAFGTFRSFARGIGMASGIIAAAIGPFAADREHNDRAIIAAPLKTHGGLRDES